MHIALRWALSSASVLVTSLAASAAAAQFLAQPAVQAGAADPGASVPATSYQPVIAYRPEAAPAAAPDRNWAAGNAAVAAYNPMSLTMKGMKGMQGHDAPAHAPADPHAGHAGHAAPVTKPPAHDHKESP